MASIQRLLEQGENLSTEFKSDLEGLGDAELLATVVCLANGGGGTILIGVEDDGTITGLHPKHQTRPELLAALIANKTVPPVITEVIFETFRQNNHDLLVAVINVPKSHTPVATTEGRMVIRYQDVHGHPGCRPLYPHEIAGWLGDRGLQDNTSQPVIGATWEDFDPIEFHRLRNVIQASRGDLALLPLNDLELARALGLVVFKEGNHIPTFSGLLLVGRESALRDHIPTHEVAFQVLRKTEVIINDFYRGPLIKVLEQINQSFQVRNDERELNLGPYRVPIPTYDFRAFREAVNNAVVHRDYTKLGAVHIQIQDDRLVISNPGNFVRGVRLDNLLVIGPVPRNPRLADCFKRIGLVERTGRGVGIIYEGQLRNGRTAPIYREFQDKVTLTLQGNPTNLKFVELVLQEEQQRGQTFRISELLILEHIYRYRDTDEPTIATLIQEDRNGAKEILIGLVERGLLEKRGNPRSRTYHLSAQLYKDLGQPESYIYAHGFDPIQREQMVIQYTRKHGKITRSEIKNLCRTDENETTWILRKLMRQGILEMKGEGRKSHYVYKDSKILDNQ